MILLCSCTLRVERSQGSAGERVFLCTYCILFGQVEKKISLRVKIGKEREVLEVSAEQIWGMTLKSTHTHKAHSET